MIYEGFFLQYLFGIRVIACHAILKYSGNVFPCLRPAPKIFFQSKIPQRSMKSHLFNMFTHVLQVSALLGLLSCVIWVGNA